MQSFPGGGAVAGIGGGGMGARPFGRPSPAHHGGSRGLSAGVVPGTGLRPRGFGWNSGGGYGYGGFNGGGRNVNVAVVVPQACAQGCKLKCGPGACTSYPYSYYGGGIERPSFYNNPCCCGWITVIIIVLLIAAFVSSGMSSHGTWVRIETPETATPTETCVHPDDDGYRLANGDGLMDDACMRVYSSFFLYPEEFGSNTVRIFDFSQRLQWTATVSSIVLSGPTLDQVYNGILAPTATSTTPTGAPGESQAIPQQKWRIEMNGGNYGMEQIRLIGDNGVPTTLCANHKPRFLNQVAATIGQSEDWLTLVECPSESGRIIETEFKVAHVGWYSVGITETSM